MSSTDFASLDLAPALVENLASLGYLTMTPVQAEGLPPVLAGRDLIAQAKTGSGKTATFGLGLLNRLDPKRFRVQSLVLCPTRELADQVAGELRRLARGIDNVKILTLCGGVPIGPQIGSLEHGAHIVVGTPGRIDDHLRKATLSLDDATTLVLDEADRMLEMGFQDIVETILSYLPKPRQTLLFSATWPDEIRALAQRHMVDPVTVTVDASHDAATIRQQFHQVADDGERLTALRRLLLAHKPESTLVFCNMKVDVDAVNAELVAHGFASLALHGDLEQRARDQALVRFANRSVSVLVCTDVAARGLDIDDLDLVVNYQVARDRDVHLHRIGRTGRAGSSGRACTLFVAKEQHRIDRLPEFLSEAIPPEPLPPASVLNEPVFKPPMRCLEIDGGRKQKVRPGDIVGALTGEGGIAADQIGKISVQDQCAYVAVRRDLAKQALGKLAKGKLKGRTFRVRQVGG
ncbi:MAG TPA: ATP-dependent RNA helicase DbpA [Pseudomonadales bacterium]|nr:ATP-dependent RNA helicase DbpA [Pseudomonadales bacterium]